MHVNVWIFYVPCFTYRYALLTANWMWPKYYVYLLNKTPYWEGIETNMRQNKQQAYNLNSCVIVACRKVIFVLRILKLSHLWPTSKPLIVFQYIPCHFVLTQPLNLFSLWMWCLLSGGARFLCRPPGLEHLLLLQVQEPILCAFVTVLPTSAAIGRHRLLSHLQVNDSAWLFGSSYERC